VSSAELSRQAERAGQNERDLSQGSVASDVTSISNDGASFSTTLQRKQLRPDNGRRIWCRFDGDSLEKSKGGRQPSAFPVPVASKEFRPDHCIGCRASRPSTPPHQRSA
jgi:hypothetical protein